MAHVGQGVFHVSQPDRAVFRLGQGWINKSLPRIALDAAGGQCLLLRHHPLPGGAGEVWSSFALRYDGKTWSPPIRLPASEDLLDNRPAILPYGHGVLVVHTSDQRSRTLSRKQNDLFATVLSFPASTCT
jgi:hypothetical protein